MFKLYMYKVLLIILIIFILLIFFYRNKKEAYENNVSGIESKYDFELKYELMDKFNNFNEEIHSFNTLDDEYKCHFYNSKPVKQIPFIRTIIPEKFNNVYTLDTTKCSTTTENCSDDTNNNIDIKLFYDNVDNVDYSINRNKTFLHLDDGLTYQDFDLVSPEEMPITYKTTYDICVPKTNKYDYEYKFDELFPCGNLVCHKSTDDVQNIESDLRNSVETLVKNDHQTKIDSIIESVGFTTWVDNLNTVQRRNEGVRDMCDSPNDSDCLTDDDMVNVRIKKIMSDNLST